MAEKNSFVLGVLTSDFMQLKTTDNIYLKDIISNGIEQSLALYNDRTLGLANLLGKRFTQANSNSKRIYSADKFTRIGEIETPGMRSELDVWNTPIPMERFGSLTGLTMERLVQMSSDDLVTFHNGKIIADQANIVQNFFRVCLTKAPAGVVDCLDGMATEYKPFWNDEASMDTPRPNGQITFDGDHDHYNSVATANTVIAADIDNKLLSEVREHEGMNNGVALALWAAPGTTFGYLEALDGYTAVVKTPEILGSISPEYLKSGTAQALVTGMKNQAWNVNIKGTYSDAICIESPDIPAGYILCTANFGNNDDRNPLGWREHPAFIGMNLQSPSGGNPVIGLDAQYRRYLGLGIRNRSAGAVLYTVDTSWAEPSFV